MRRFHYQLEPAHAGKHLIRSVAIEFVDKRAGGESRGEPALIETEPMELEVTSELGGRAPSLAELEPMLPPRPVRERGAMGWLIGAAAVVLLAVPVIFWLRRRKLRPVLPPRKTPEEIAREALCAYYLPRISRPGVSSRSFIFALPASFASTWKTRRALAPPEQTTEEFLRDMRAAPVFPPERSVQLAEFLEAADLVKYAGQQPGTGQVDQATERAPSSSP